MLSVEPSHARLLFAMTYPEDLLNECRLLAAPCDATGLRIVEDCAAKKETIQWKSQVAQRCELPAVCDWHGPCRIRQLKPLPSLPHSPPQVLNTPS